MHKKVKILIYIMLLSLVVVGCSSKDAAKSEQESTNAIPVQIEVAKDGNINGSSGISGKFAPKEIAEIAPKVSGKITSIPVKLGQSVKVGDVLFSVDPSDLRNAVNQAEAGYKVALANLQQAQTSSSQGIDQAQTSLLQAKNSVVQAEQSYQNAKLKADRTKALFEAGAVASVELENDMTALRNAEIALKNANATYESTQKSMNYSQKKSAVEVAKASVTQAKVNLDNARFQLENAVIKSPITGVVSAINGSIGSMGGPQAPVVTVVNIKPIVVKASLSESEVTKVKVGTPVLITVPAVNKQIEASITAISPVMDQQKKSYPIEIEIPNQDQAWKSDMVVNIVIKSSDENVTKLVLTRSAVFEEQGKKYVYIIVDNKAKKVEVNTGLESSKQIEIISGVSNNDKVVTKGQTLLKDGAKVNIQNK